MDTDFWPTCTLVNALIAMCLFQVVNQSVLDCLRYANIHYYNSIAFPAVGLELYPAEVIAQSMFEAVVEFEEEQAATHSTPTLGRVVFAIGPTNHAVDDHFVLEVALA